jgi:hypothetical protein
MKKHEQVTLQVAAYKPEGIDTLADRSGVMALKVNDNYLEQARSFWKPLADGKPLKIVVSLWHKPRTLAANALFHVIVRRIAEKVVEPDDSFDDVFDNIKLGIKFNAMAMGYPSEKIVTRTGTRMFPRPSRFRDQREFSILIETALSEAYFHEVKDFMGLALEWNQYNRSKNDGRNAFDDVCRDDAQYKELHPYCEACFKGLLEDEGQFAHIVPESEGGLRVYWNLMRLCTKCHMQTWHQHGLSVLMEKYPIITRKVRSAQKRMAEDVKNPLDGGGRQE